MRAAAGLVLLLALAAPAQARIDRSFADGRGWKTIRVGAYDSGGEAVLRTRSGKILVGGFGDEPRTYRTVFAFTRLHRSGRPDRRFGRNGRALVDVGEWGPIVAMRELPSRRILIAFAPHETPQRFSVARLLANGRIDRGYGTGGLAHVTVPGENAELADMAVLPGGAVVLAGSTRLAPLDVRVVIARLGRDGQAGRVSTPALAGAHALGLVRTRPGHLVLAANRPRAAGRPAFTLLTGLGDNPWRRVIEGVRAQAIQPDRRSGVALLLFGRGRWGVRRYSEDFTPRRAPAKLPSRGRPSDFAIGPGSRAWVGLDGGRMARVRSDGRPIRRSGPLRTRFLLETAAVAALPRGRAVAVGRAAPEDTGDLREDYGPSRMWAGVFR